MIRFERGSWRALGLSLAVAAAALACEEPQPVAPAVEASPPPPAPTAAVVSPPPEKSPPEAPSPFTLYAELPSDARLHALDLLAPDANRRGDAAFVVFDQYVLRIDGDDVTLDPQLLDGLGKVPKDTMYYVEELAGRWPDAAFAAVGRPSGRTGLTDVLTWNGRGWKHVNDTRVTTNVMGFRRWTQGRLLALVKHQMAPAYEFAVFGGPKVALPQPARAPATAGTINWGMPLTRLSPQEFQTLPTGEVFAAGMLEEGEGEATKEYLAVERWGPNGGASTIEKVADAPKRSRLNVLGLWVLAPDKAFLRATFESRPPTPGVHNLRFDGKAFRHVSEQELVAEVYPPKAGAMRLEGDRVLRGDGKVWLEAPLPRLELDLTPTELLDRGAGDVWVVAKGKSGKHYLLHTRPPAKAPNLPGRDEAMAKANADRAPSPPSPGCFTPFVMLYTLAKTAPPDFDFPATREALKGHTELKGKATFIEFKRFDQRFLGARVESFDVARKLADLVKAKVPGSTPQVACHDPVETRVLDIDLATGALRKP